MTKLQSVMLNGREVLVLPEVMRELDLVEGQAVDHETYGRILEKMRDIAAAMAAKPKH